MDRIWSEARAIASASLRITAMLAATLAASPAAAIVIDFDNVNNGPVTNQYAALGVTFSNATVLDYSVGPLAIPGFAHSGTKAVEPCYAEEFCYAPVRIDFTAAQARVKVWVGYSSGLAPERTVHLRGFNAAGNEVARDSLTLGPSTTPTLIRLPLQVGTFAGNIVRIEVGFAGTGENTNGLAVDDVEFDTIGPPPPCLATSAPTLAVLQPGNGLITRCNRFVYRDNVTTGDPFARRTITVTGPSGQQHEWTMPAVSGIFGTGWLYGFLFPGVNTLTVRVEDCGGAVTRVVDVTYDPFPADMGFEVIGWEATQTLQE